MNEEIRETVVPRERLVLAPHLTERSIDGELVIYDADRQKVHALNPTAAFIWRLLASTGDPAAAVDSLTERYPDWHEAISSDVADLVGRLRIRRAAEMTCLTWGSLVEDACGLAHVQCRPTGGAVVRLLSFSARVETGCQDVLANLTALYPGAARAQEKSWSSPSTSFLIEECCQSRRHSVLLREAGEPSEFFDSAQDAIAHLDALINASAMRHLGFHILIHAGSLAWGDAGIVIPGESGAGKSTLVAALAMSGFKYLSDELAVLELASGDLFPFPKPICLKSGGWKAILTQVGTPEFAMMARRFDGEAVTYVSPPERATMAEGISTRYVLLPARVSGVKARLSPCSRSTAFVELARNSPNLPRHGAAAVETLAGLVEGASCFVLRYDGLREAVKLVSELVGAPATHVGRAPADRAPASSRSV